jgi:hypothetical protein
MKKKPYANKTPGYEMTINNAKEDLRRTSKYLLKNSYGFCML